MDRDGVHLTEHILLIDGIFDHGDVTRMRSDGLETTMHQDRNSVGHASKQRHRDQGTDHDHRGDRVGHAHQRRVQRPGVTLQTTK